MNNEEIIDIVENFLAPIVIVAIAFTIYFQQFTVNYILLGIGLAVLVLAIKHIGQKTIAQWMDAYIDVELSKQGSLLTLIVSGISAVTGASIALIIPTTSSFGQEKHEHWGKSVDAMWSKREYWIAFGGIMLLTATSITALAAGWMYIAQAITIFTLSQLIPFRDLIIEGTTDGTYILFHSGFTWLTITGLNIIVLASTAF